MPLLHCIVYVFPYNGSKFSCFHVTPFPFTSPINIIELGTETYNGLTRYFGYDL